MTKLFANSGDPDQMPHSAVSDLGLHCLPITLSGVSQLQWIETFQKTAGQPNDSLIKALLFVTIFYSFL